MQCTHTHTHTHMHTHAHRTTTRTTTASHASRVQYGCISLYRRVITKTLSTPAITSPLGARLHAPIHTQRALIHIDNSNNKPAQYKSSTHTTNNTSRLHNINTQNSTLHNAHCTLHTAHCTLHIAHCTLRGWHRLRHTHSRQRNSEKL